jgi:hypothetical protein
MEDDYWHTLSEKYYTTPAEQTNITRAASGLAPTIYGGALLRVSPQEIVILPHHNILLNAK